MKTFNLFILLILLVSACYSKKVSKDDKKMLITASDIVNDYRFDIKKLNTGKFAKENFLGTIDLSYEYESSDKEGDYLYIYHTISKETNTSEARDTYAINAFGDKYFREKGVTFEKKEGWFTYGDASSLSLVIYENEPTGFLFTFRKQKYVYYFLIYGLYFEAEEDWIEFITPKLKEFEDLKEGI